jgi:hypothetical protein
MIEIGTRVNVAWDGRGFGRINDHEDGQYEVVYEPGTKGARKVGSEWLVPGAERGLMHGDFIVLSKKHSSPA